VVRAHGVLPDSSRKWLAAGLVAFLLAPPPALAQGLAAAREAEARALSDKGAEAFAERKVAEAIDYHARAGAIFRDLGLRAEEAASLAAIGDVLLYLFNYEAAIPKYEEALRLLRGRAGAEPLRARASLALGRAQMMLGRREAAIAHIEEALALFRGLGDQARTAEAQALLSRLR
jgi:tetratricopeptide (TPR) repeat protein